MFGAPMGNLEGYLTRSIGWLLMPVCSGRSSRKERHWCNPNNRRELWRGYSWPPKPSHIGFYHRLLSCRRIFLCTEEFYMLGYHASVSQQKVFWKTQTFPSLSWNEKLVMAIMTVVAIKTIMYLRTNMHLSGIEPGIECKELIQGWLF